MYAMKEELLALIILSVFLSVTVGVILPPLSTASQGTQVDEKTRHVLHIFEQISAIPRCSKHEQKISKWLKKWAKNHGLKVRTDSVGNVLIKVPAAKGYKNAPEIVLQGHMDMVCQKTPDSDHDFSKDPIRMIYEGKWLRADKTTLGADDGIGIAIGLALAEDKAVSHPPLELLFTVNEEAGFTGVFALKKGFLKGRIFLNLDSEKEGVLTIGSAGAGATVIDLPISMNSISKDYKAYKLRAHGMRGGHSGVDIHEHRANGIKILAQALNEVNRSSEIRLISIKGGTAVNAIPRDVEALIACEPRSLSPLKTLLSDFEQRVRNEYRPTEKSMALTLSQIDPKTSVKSALTTEDTDRVIELLLALPNGVAEMSSNIEGFIEASNNLGIVGTKKKALRVVSLQRGSTMSKLEKITEKVETMASRAGARAKTGGSIPAWEPNMKSPLLQRCKEVYKDVFGKEAVVAVVHGGLECSVIGQKYPHLDMIALGPTVVDLHSPDEKLHIPSVGKVWQFLVVLLGSYGQ